jgi:hypothetical protein
MPDPSITFIDDVAGALQTIYGAAASDAAKTVEGISFDYLDEMAEKYGKERGGELVGMKNIDGKWVPNPNAEWVVSETTRERTNELLQQAMDEGWSPQKFSEALEESGLYGEARADMIARTEVAIAQNYGQVETYSAAGVTEVYVFDGDEDTECSEANGQTWSVEDALDKPTAHPNCTRSFSPKEID